jgi:hypothetical protein
MHKSAQGDYLRQLTYLEQGAPTQILLLEMLAGCPHGPCGQRTPHVAAWIRIIAHGIRVICPLNNGEKESGPAAQLEDDMACKGRAIILFREWVLNKRQRVEHLHPVGYVLHILRAGRRAAQLEHLCNLLPKLFILFAPQQLLKKAVCIAPTVLCCACLWTGIICHHLPQPRNIHLHASQCMVDIIGGTDASRSLVDDLAT